MDLAERTLSDEIKSRKIQNNYFKKEEIKNFLRNTIPIMSKMQKAGYMHRDIKPDNLMFRKGKFGIIDFGFGVKYNEYSDRNIAGTREYVSPKLLVKFKDSRRSVKGHTIQDDVFSFGKILYEMMTLNVCN